MYCSHFEYAYYVTFTDSRFFGADDDDDDVDGKEIDAMPASVSFGSNHRQ